MPIKCENDPKVVQGRRDEPISSMLEGLSLEGTTNHYTERQQNSKITDKGIHKYPHDYVDKNGNRRKKWKKDCPNPTLQALENHAANTRIAKMRMEGKKKAPLPETVKKRERALNAHDGCFGKFTANMKNGKKSSIQLSVIQISIALRALREFEEAKYNDAARPNHFDFIDKLKELNSNTNKTAIEYIKGYVPQSRFWNFLVPSDVAEECDLRAILTAIRADNRDAVLAGNADLSDRLDILRDAVLVAALSLTSSLHNKKRSAAKSAAVTAIQSLAADFPPMNKEKFQGALAAVGHKHCSMLNVWEGASSKDTHKKMWVLDFASQFPGLALDEDPYRY